MTKTEQICQERLELLESNITAHKSEISFWKSEYLTAYKELVKANKGIARLKKKLKYKNDANIYKVFAFEKWNLSMAITNALRFNDIYTTAELKKWTISDLSHIKNMGPNRIGELTLEAKQHGIHINES